MVETINTAAYKVRLDLSALPNDLKKADKLIENSLDSASDSIGSEFKNAMKNVDTTFNKSLSKMASSTKQKSDFMVGLIMSAADRAFNYVANTISNSLSSAVSRVDTLNNFPKVMESLGYSAEEAAGSVDSISNSLDGLPTSLDDMATNVQKLSATMGNLNSGTINATTVGLAFNNMMLAGGKGTEAAVNAFEQYNQMLAVGKVDQQAWNSVVNAAPGQMKQLAETLLGAGSNAQDLYGAMKDGVVTFEDFNSAIVKLNTEGGDSFESFEAQARSATGGIGTAMENVQNRVNKAVGSVIDAIGQSNISGAINQFSSQFGKLGNAIASAITGEGDPQALIQDFVTGISQSFMTVLPQIGELAGKILPVLLQAFVQILPGLVQGGIDLIINFVDQISTAIPTVLPQIVQAIIDVFLSLSNPENLSKILQAGIDLLMSLVDALPTVLQALIEALPMIIENIVTFLTENLPVILDAFVQLFMSLIEALPIVLQSLLGALPNIINTITGFLLRPETIMTILNAAIKVFFALIDAIPQIIGVLAEALPNIIISIVDFLTKPETIGMILEAAVTLFFALVDAVPRILGALLESFGKLIGGLWEGIKTMFGRFAENFGEFIGGIFKGAINGVLGFIEGLINTPIGIINGFVDVINGAFGWIGVHLGQIDKVSLPRLYTGGIVPATRGGMPILAGDGGEDEWVVPESKMASLIEQLEDRGNNGGSPVFNFYFEGVLGTPSEMRELAIQFHDAYEQVQKARFA